MEKDREKIQEPFDPQDTPRPPQIIEPDSGRQRENPVKDEKREQHTSAKKSAQNEKQHLLADESDISDETTV